MKRIFDATIDKIHDDLDHRLEPAGLIGRRFFGSAIEEPDKCQAQQHGPKHRVDVERHWIASTVIPDPFPRVVLADLQVLQMVLDILTGGLRAVSAFTCHSYYSRVLSLVVRRAAKDR